MAHVAHVWYMSLRLNDTSVFFIDFTYGILPRPAVWCTKKG